MTLSRSLVSFAAIGAAVWLVSSTARADPAAAEALFREGRRLLDEGKINEACLKLAASQAQDPSSGTLLNLGLCHEIQRKLATAWSDYVSAARLARDQGKADRAAVAEKKASEIEPRLPHLTVTVAAPVPGLEIVRDIQRLGPGVLGSAVPVDPGSYTIRAAAPGYREWKTTIELVEAESKTVQVPELEAEPEAPPAVKAREEPVSNAPPRAVLAPPPAAPPPAVQGGGPLGWIIGGGGLAVAAVGAGFGVASLASFHDADNLCPLHQGCADDAISSRNRAEWQAWVANVAIGAGVVGAAIGGWILLHPRRGGPTARVGMSASADAPTVRVTLERSFF